MADEPENQERPLPKPVNPTVMLASVVLAGILSFGLLMWAQGVRMSKVQKEAFGHGIDGLSAALALPVVEVGSLRFENRADRLQKIIETVQRAGTYTSVVVTDPKGVVLATTDTSLKGQTIADLAKAKSPATVKDVNGETEAIVPIVSDGTTTVGVLRVRTRL